MPIAQNTKIQNQNKIVNTEIEIKQSFRQENERQNLLIENKETKIA